MCGIAGYSINPSDRDLNRRRLADALLRQIVTRGRHATGLAWTPCQDETCKRPRTVGLVKAPLPAGAFIREGGTSAIPACAQNVLLHTRYATTGSPTNPANNHPIPVGTIVGIHNGVLQNDAELFDRLGGGRLAEVDSEAIFALIDRSPGIHPTEFLSDIKGDAAIAWTDRKRPEAMHLARLDGRPLAVGQTHRGSTVFASTLPLLQNACRETGVRLGWAEEITPMTYLRVVRGAIHDFLPIAEAKKVA